MESFANFENLDLINQKQPLDENGHPLERWSPLGANDSPDFNGDQHLTSFDDSSSSKLHKPPEDRDVLNKSILTLTSHFAQVQFRLEQVLRAEPDQKETLLQDLERFAWNGAPDLHLLRGYTSNSEDDSDGLSEETKKKNVSPIIEQLKTQLHDLEQYAYQNGELHEPPTQSVLQKQRLILEELGKQLGLDVSEFSSGSEEEIRERVNAAMAMLTNPMKTNETLVDQLKTQIIDLERFIEFLHDEATPDSVIRKTLEAFRRYQQEHRAGKPDSFGGRINSVDMDVSDDNNDDNEGQEAGGFHIGLSRQRTQGAQRYRERRTAFNKRTGKKNQIQTTFNVVTRALALLQLFATSQLAGRNADARLRAQAYANAATGHRYEKNASNSQKQHHWGDVRARLELAIEVVLEKALLLRSVRLKHYRSLELMASSTTADEDDAGDDGGGNEEARNPGDGRRNSSSFECCTADYKDPACANAERELNAAVRKQLCLALEDLIEHGSRLPTNSKTTGAFGGSASLMDASSHGIGGLLLSLLGCFSRNRIEGNGQAASNGVDNGEESSGEDDNDNEEEEEEECMIASEEEKRARNLRRKRSLSSAWAIFLKYYVMTNGRAFNDTPARKLSQSFALDIIGGKVVTAKQQLLSSMGTVLQEFNKYRRSEVAQFKALVCIGLNNHRLVAWLKLVLRNPFIVQYMYHPWSYVSSTGFDDALQSLNKLSSVEFRLPFDATIRHLQDIRDVF